MTKLRLSYSLLKLWSQGRTDDAIGMYYRLQDRFVSPAMEDGKRIHEEISKHVIEHGKLPHYMPNLTLSNPKCDVELIHDYNELFTVKGYIDCLDAPTLFEFKTGKTTSADLSSDFQIPFYFFLAKLSGIEIEKAYLIHHNQHTQKNDFMIIWNHPELIEKAENMIDTVGYEIWHFFNEQGII